MRDDDQARCIFQALACGGAWRRRAVLLPARVPRRCVRGKGVVENKHSTDVE